MARIAPAASVTVVPNGIDLDFFRPSGPAARRAEVVFVGVFDYAPNAAGAEWLLHEVWPKVRAKRSDATLALVGSNPSRALRRAARANPSVTVTGAVPDVRPYLWRAKVSAAPIFVARGLQNKVLEALAARLRVVTTTLVAAGLPAALAACCRVTDDAGAFAEALIESLDEAAASDCDDQLEPFRWDASLVGLGPLLASHADAVRHRMGSTVT
jgi:glycosyltransferase involved in cell wall biosynthesis